MNNDDLLKSLAGMGPEQLRDLQARASFLLNGRTAPDGAEGDQDRYIELVYDSVRDVLRQYGCLRVPPLSVLAKTGHLGPFKKGAPIIMDYATAFLRPKGRAEEAKAVRFLVEVVARRLQDRSLPVTPKTLAQGLANVHASVDRCFPGYQASGLLPLVFRRHRVA